MLIGSKRWLNWSWQGVSQDGCEGNHGGKPCFAQCVRWHVRFSRFFVPSFFLSLNFKWISTNHTIFDHKWKRTVKRNSVLGSSSTVNTFISVSNNFIFNRLTLGGCGQLGNWRRKVYSYFHSTKPSATWCNIPRVQKGNSMMIFAYVFTVEPRLRHVVYTMFLLTYSWPTRTSQTQSTPKWMVTYKRRLWQLVCKSNVSS